MRASVFAVLPTFSSLRTSAAAAAFALSLSAAVPAAAAPVALSADEFKLYKDYQAALTDARVQKLPEKKRLAAIAKNFKVAEKKLKAAIDKATPLAATAGKDSEAEIRALLASTDLKDRIADVRVDDSEGHVVTYVSWKNEKGEKLEEEAALVALLTARGAPYTSTIALWSTDLASNAKVFEAKISADAAGRFSQDRIPMFASARYIRVFENVRNTYKGNPPAN